MKFKIPHRFDVSTESKTTKCPLCGKPFELVTGDWVPEEGDVTVCAYCHEVLIFRADLTLKIPNLDQQLTIDSDPGIGIMKKAVREVGSKKR